jgi:hypothetical protein
MYYGVECDVFCCDVTITVPALTIYYGFDRDDFCCDVSFTVTSLTATVLTTTIFAATSLLP